MQKIMTILLMVVLTLTLLGGVGLPGCGTSNHLSKYSTTTKAQQAKQALDGKNYQQAITLYNQLIKDNPTQYDLYPLLSVALASLAGISVLDMVKAQISNTGKPSTGTNLLANISTYVPASPSDAQVTMVQGAITTLQAIPIANRSLTSDVVYASSASFQLTLYLSASSLMVINKYKQVTTTGTLDPAKLSTMSDADVNQVLNNLETVAATMPDSAAAKAVSSGATDVLAKIDAYPGETNKDKLLAYIAATQGAPKP